MKHVPTGQFHYQGRRPLAGSGEEEAAVEELEEAIEAIICFCLSAMLSYILE